MLFWSWNVVLQPLAQQVELDQKLLADFRAEAEDGDAISQYNLGVCYADGKGVAKDYVEAVKWFRKAAEQNFAPAQLALGGRYGRGEGVAEDQAEAVRWYRKAAQQNLAEAQYYLGACCANGAGVAKDESEAVKWWRAAAKQGNTMAQNNLAACYAKGRGVGKNEAEAIKWYRKAAEQNDSLAQRNLGFLYFNGDGVVKDYVEAYRWMLLAAAHGDDSAKRVAATLERAMTPELIAEGQKLARAFTPNAVPVTESDKPHPESSGTGFFITEDGYLITNYHVTGSGSQVRLVTKAGFISAKIVKLDAANDLALLKAEGRFAALPIASSRLAKMGTTVATVGFPNIGLQGFAPKLAKGEVAALTGAQDDPRYFQISVPLQPGNSGGALLDGRGNVIGIVAAKLSAGAALATSGALPENVNYAVKSSFLLSFLESVPEASAKLMEPNKKEREFEDVVKSAEQAAVLVLVY
jgi:TPR repeat protein